MLHLLRIADSVFPNEIYNKSEVNIRIDEFLKFMDIVDHWKRTI